MSYSIIISDKDYSDCLLEDGIHSVVNEVQSKIDFSPVCKTLEVKLSDLDDHSISKALGLQMPGELLVRKADNVIVPISKTSLFPVKVYDGESEDPFFTGYIDNQTINRHVVDAENPDSEYIVEFTVNSTAKHYFDKWSASNFWYLPTYDQYTYAGNTYFTLRLLLESLTMKNNTGVSAASVEMSSDYSNLVFYSPDFKQMFLDMQKMGGVPSIPDFLVDLAKYLFAFVRIDDNGVFEFKNRFAALNSMPRKVITDFVRLDYTPMDYIAPDWIKSVRPELTFGQICECMVSSVMPTGVFFYFKNGVRFALNGQPMSAYFGVGSEFLTMGYRVETTKRPISEVSAWYGCDGRMTTDSGKTPSGQTYDAIPGFSQYLNNWTYFRMMGRGDQSSCVFKPTDTIFDHYNFVIDAMVGALPRVKIKVPGHRFDPYMAITLSGDPNWVCLSANCDSPMKDDESELLLEYRG